MKKYIVFLLTLILFPLNAYAVGGFSVSNKSISMYPGETRTITISSNNAVGKLNISSSNGSVASINTSGVFIQTPGATESITITAKSVGTATVSVVASDNFATMDEEILKGKTEKITIKVVEKPSSQPANPNNNKPDNNLSKNNNIKDLSVEGYDLEKVDSNNYTLNVTNNVISIKVIATAEDAKAKISGDGVHDLQVGENVVEVIITSESGAQNKIKIKITRKDGYYLEDLEEVLKNTELKEADIIISKDSIISSNVIKDIKESKKTIRFNYYDEDKKLIYSWIVNGSKLTNYEETLNLDLDIKYASNANKEIYEQSNYADGIHFSFKHNGNLPENVIIQVYVDNRFANGNVLSLYEYTKENKKLSLVKMILR